ncbi:MAG TPA: DegT/DnrJ/EryC1/StrS family aminotransferase, partial [Burkholderiales bacterium]|nr:DegT/DnrJ/EryC1/StrS family aminotransferase [Burkholderiales bacterium]
DQKQTSLTPVEFIAGLARERIEARHVWKPMHLQPLFANCAYYPNEEGASFSDEIFARGVCLPSGSNMSRDQQNRIIDVIRSLLARPLPAQRLPSFCNS